MLSSKAALSHSSHFYYYFKSLNIPNTSSKCQINTFVAWQLTWIKRQACPENSWGNIRTAHATMCCSKSCLIYHIPTGMSRTIPTVSFISAWTKFKTSHSDEAIVELSRSINVSVVWGVVRQVQQNLIIHASYNTPWLTPPITIKFQSSSNGNIQIWFWIFSYLS